MGVVKNIMVRAVADFSALVSAAAALRDRLRNLSDSTNSSTRRMNEDMNRRFGSMGGAVMNLKQKLMLLIATWAGFQGLRMATEDAMKFDAMMSTLNGRLGSSSKAFNEWADTQGRALGYSKMQIAEYGNTFSNMLLTVAKDEQDLQLKTQEMMKATAIITSKTGMSREEVLRRMRSAMNMEADGADELGINVRASAVMMSKAYKELGDGKPLASLQDAQRKSILQQYVLEEVTKRYGTTVADNVSNRNAQFVASLYDLRLALGQAILPVWNAVLPGLTAMADGLSKVMNKVRVFMEALFGKASSAPDTTVRMTKNIKDQAGAISDAAAAQEELNKKKAEGSGLQSFDEIHTLPEPKAVDAPTTETGTGAGAGGLPDADATEEKLSKTEKHIQELAGKFKQWMQPVWAVIKQVGDAIKEYLMDKVHEVGAWWSENGAMIQQAMKNVWSVLYPIFQFIVEMIWNDIKHAIDGLLNMFMGIVTFLAGVFTGNWSAAWEGLKQLFFGLVEALWGIVNLLFYGKILKGIKLGALGIVDLFKEIGPKLKDLWTMIWKFFVDVLPRWLADIATPIKTKFLELGVAIEQVFMKAWNTIKDVFKVSAAWFYTTFIKPVITNFALLFDTITEAASAAWDAVKKAWNVAKKWFSDYVVTPIANAFDDMSSTIGSAMSSAWSSIKSTFSSVVSWFADNVVNPVRSAFNRITDGLGEGITNGFKLVYNKVVGFLNDMIGMLNKAIGGMNKLPGVSISTIPEIPRLARGGIVNGRTDFGNYIAGEAGTEMVVPLENTSFVQKLAGALGTAVLSAMQVSMSGNNKSSGDIVIQMDGTTVGRLLNPHLAREANRQGNAMLKIT